MRGQYWRHRRSRLAIPFGRLVSFAAPCSWRWVNPNKEGCHGQTTRETRWQTTDLPPQLEQVNLNAAGIDIGSEEHWVAVPEGRDPEGQDVRCFGAFTTDLRAVAEWLTRCGIDTVAMESTGVYWIPLYELLESRGFEVYLVNPGHLKNVPGRKTDVEDCQWAQVLHTFGLLRASFRPEEEICRLRGYHRQRQMLVEYRSHHIQHMQKALEQMNVKLHKVVADLTGTTGMAIIRALLAGQCDPVALAKLRDRRCKNPAEVIAKSLEGTWRAEHLFALKQAVTLYDAYTEQLAACDRQIEAHLKTLEDRSGGQPPPSRAKKARQAGPELPSNYSSGHRLRGLGGGGWSNLGEFVAQRPRAMLEPLEEPLAIACFIVLHAEVDVLGAVLEHVVEDARELVSGRDDRLRGAQAGFHPAVEGAEGRLAAFEAPSG